MIPAPFEYSRPADAAAALELLARRGDAAVLLAGGCSLIPMMKLRFARPEHVVDIRALPEWRGVAVGDDGVRIGATTAQAEIIASEELAAACPLLRETALQIADPQVRAMGTIGGNAANGDPGNDMPAVLVALDADYELSSVQGTRQVKAREFYLGAFDTARRPDEALTAILIRPAPGGAAYVKQKRKVGDYATAAAAAVVEMRDGQCVRAALVLTNAGPAPLQLPEAAAALQGTPLDDEALNRAAAVAEAEADPPADERGPAAFRKKLAGVMTRRALTLARDEVVGEKYPRPPTLSPDNRPTPVNIDGRPPCRGGRGYFLADFVAQENSAMTTIRTQRRFLHTLWSAATRGLLFNGDFFKVGNDGATWLFFAPRAAWGIMRP